MIENVIVAMDIGESLTNTSSANNTGSSPAKAELNSPFRYQRDAPQDLDLVSWPPRKRLPVFGKMKGYRFDVAKGIDTYIYIIGNGLNKDNAVRTPTSPPPFFCVFNDTSSRNSNRCPGHPTSGTTPVRLPQTSFSLSKQIGSTETMSRCSPAPPKRIMLT